MEWPSVLPGEATDEGIQLTTHAAAENDNNDAHWSTRDFDVYNVSLEWAANVVGSQSIMVWIRNDTIFEASLEALTLTLRDAVNADVDASGRDNSVVTIADDDSAPLVHAREYNVVYWLNSSTTGVVPVDVVSGDAALVATVNYTVTGGSAILGTHYETQTGQLTWAAHDRATKYVDVALLWANIPFEAELTLGVYLTPISNAPRRDGSGDGRVGVGGVVRVRRRGGRVPARDENARTPPVSSRRARRRCRARRHRRRPRRRRRPRTRTRTRRCTASRRTSNPPPSRTPTTGALTTPPETALALTPAFAPYVYAYDVYVDNAYDSVRIEYQSRSATATYSSVASAYTAATAPATTAHLDLSGGRRKTKRRRRRNLLQSSTLTQSFPLQVGTTVVTWVVLAADGVTTQNYTLSVRRYSPTTANYVSAFSLLAGTFNATDSTTTYAAVTFNETFSQDVTQYYLTAALAHDVTTFTAAIGFVSSSEVLLATMALSPIANVSDPQITTLDPSTASSTSAISLSKYAPDTETVTVRVLANDGLSAREYHVLVQRAAPSSPPPPPPPAARRRARRRRRRRTGRRSRRRRRRRRRRFHLRRRRRRRHRHLPRRRRRRRTRCRRPPRTRPRARTARRGRTNPPRTRRAASTAPPGTSSRRPGRWRATRARRGRTRTSRE